MSSFWALELKRNPPASVCWQWYGWPRGIRSWTPGSTSYWERLFWGKSSCCFTAAGAQSFTPSTAGSAAHSAAPGRWANLTASATADSPFQTLPSNSSPESWSGAFNWNDVSELKHYWVTTQTTVAFFPKQGGINRSLRIIISTLLHKLLLTMWIFLRIVCRKFNIYVFV